MSILGGRLGSFLASRADGVRSRGEPNRMGRFNLMAGHLERRAEHARTRGRASGCETILGREHICKLARCMARAIDALRGVGIYLRLARLAFAGWLARPRLA